MQFIEKLVGNTSVDSIMKTFTETITKLEVHANKKDIEAADAEVDRLVAVSKKDSANQESKRALVIRDKLAKLITE